MTSREYPDRPIVAVGGVVWHEGRVLLAQRGKQPGYGTWSIPGGGLKLGETLRQGVAREVKEECGIDVVAGEVVDAVDRVVRDAEGRVQFHYVILDFACTYKGGDLRAASDCLAARWVAPEELAAYSLTPAALAVIARARYLLSAPPPPSRSDADDAPARAPGR
ncbi:MAG: NUDIX hydrolase [Chloroflexi bacterium]|nr:NUDIX hydrolase [Chloroflexota bacterium]